MRIAIASDHAGLDLKKFLVSNLSGQNVVQDLGTHSSDSVDYPDFARRVAEAILEGRADRGVLVCGTGIGMSIAANKFPGIRSAVVSETFSARASVEHNDLNVLALGGRVIGPDLALEVVLTFLEATFQGGRHQRRLALISSLESGR